jgi:hypothetical protein
VIQCIATPKRAGFFAVAVTASLKLLVSVPPICLGRWNKPKLTRMNKAWVRLVSMLHIIHVKLSKNEAVDFFSHPIWVKCCLHSCPFLSTGLESLLCGHSDERRMSMSWGVAVLLLCFVEVCKKAPVDFYRALVQRANLMTIITKSVTEGPSVKVLAKRFEICSAT